PFEGEAVRAEAELGAEPDVRRVPVPVVARVAARLAAGRRRIVLPRPPVVVPVAALDLVRGRRRSPHEALGEACRHAREANGAARERSSRRQAAEEAAHVGENPAATELREMAAGVPVNARSIPVLPETLRVCRRTDAVAERADDEAALAGDEWPAEERRMHLPELAEPGERDPLGLGLVAPQPMERLT